ncbi:Mth938-like domain-containing protein [Fodinibius sp. Rm-B-1B1-1]|uniref:Mth938-like domain-containing protein n=1 Tax=Fodinibius alkaliphilus TaxID=3140241 RepID=UPI00315A3EAA
MDIKTESPKINSIEWGKINVGDNHIYKDAKLFPGGSREWDWNETGTHHQPGIQPADVEELVDKNAQVIILSKGFHKRLQVCDETVDFLKENEITFHILETGKAAEKYNDIRKENPTGALIHSTC